VKVGSDAREEEDKKKSAPADLCASLPFAPRFSDRSGEDAFSGGVRVCVDKEDFGLLSLRARRIIPPVRITTAFSIGRERMSEKLKIGFIGTGNIAGSHIPNLAKRDDVELAAFCDVDQERTQKRADEFGAKAFASAKEMLDSVALDGVFLCLPPFAHGEAEMACIERKVPFLIEKPVGMDVETIARIADAVDEANLLTSVGYMNRYRHSVNRAREHGRSHPFIQMHGGWIGGKPVNRPASWWGKKDKSGGQLVEQTTHTVDLVRYLGGDAEEVFCYSTRAFNNIPGVTIEDASILTIKLKSGGLATLISAAACTVGGGVWLTAWSEAGRFDFTGWEHAVKVALPNKERVEIGGEDNIFALEDNAFIEALKTGDRSLIKCEYRDGAKSGELAIAGNESMETGQPVKVGQV
jgi:predicted dehydrogenase